ncbi:hypothetical protein HY734_02955 [Candidatus Uhrbacteria bacterium]|nr:hypothetical protein [Candidatus Uhrbacteria bacterium]
MSTLALRHHATTLAFLPVRRSRRIDNVIRMTRVSLSRRQVRRTARAILERLMA